MRAFVVVEVSPGQKKNPLPFGGFSQWAMNGHSWPGGLENIENTINCYKHNQQDWYKEE